MSSDSVDETLASLNADDTALQPAPGLLIRRPGVLFSVIGAATILSLVAAMTPLFLSSASSAALLRELEGRCPASFAGTRTLFGTLEGQHPESMTELIEENRENVSTWSGVSSPRSPEAGPRWSQPPTTPMPSATQIGSGPQRRTSAPRCPTLITARRVSPAPGSTHPAGPRLPSAGRAGR